MSVTEMEHVLVLCDDIEATRSFYCDVVGLRVGERPPLEFPGYWLYAGATACVHVADRDAYRAHVARLGLSALGPVDHIACSAGDYEALCDRLDREGVAGVRNTVPDGGPRQVFIEDPNGVRIEINVAQPPAEVWG